MAEERKNPITRIVIKGFKSIKECDLDLKNINVLIGANGAGKSNFISVFELLDYVLANELPYYGNKKGADTIFHNGVKVTKSIKLETHYKWYCHSCELEMSDINSIFSIKNDMVSSKGFFGAPSDFYEKHPWASYHFNDTGSSALLKMSSSLSNNVMLLPDASNLSAFLFRLQKTCLDSYKRILKAIQRVAPYFMDFVLLPEIDNNEHVILRWQEKGRKDVLSASQLSDGTLRFICLATLLLQPEELQPPLIIIDEPELGLHPYAMTIFAELVKKAAAKKQIILATQSTELLDNFNAEDVIVVDKTADGSEFKRLDAKKLSAWLEDDYSLGELWNKNLFGGRVTR
jgi:predicted ATPase